MNHLQKMVAKVFEVSKGIAYSDSTGYNSNKLTALLRQCRATLDKMKQVPIDYEPLWKALAKASETLAAILSGASNYRLLLKGICMDCIDAANQVWALSRQEDGA